MVVYILVFLILFLTLFPKLPNRKDLLIGGLVLMYFIGMFRSLSVGTDNLIYSVTFNKTSWETLFKPSDGVNETDFELGYSMLIVFFRNVLFDNYTAFMAISFFLTMSLFLSFINRSKDVYISVFLFYALSFYFLSLNIMRQMMGCALILSLLSFFIKKQIGVIPFCIWIVLVSFGFHKSLFIFLLVVILYQKPFVDYFSKKKLLIILAIISFLFLLGFSSLQDSISSIRELFLLLGNERYAEYLSPDNLGETNISVFSSFIKLLFVVFLIRISPCQLLKSFSFIGLYLSICSSNILGSVSVLFTRISTNIEIMFVFFIPYLYSVLKEYEKRTLLVVTIGYGTVFFINYLYKGYAGVVPYKTFLFDF